MSITITDIPFEIFGLHLSRTIKSQLVQTSSNFKTLRKPLESYFAFSDPTFIRLYINLLDTVKTKSISKITIDNAKSDYHKGVRNVVILNVLILYYLKNQSSNYIFKIYKLYKDHLTLLYEADYYDKIKIKKLFSIIYEFAKLNFMINLVDNKHIKKSEYEEYTMTIISEISQKVENTKQHSAKQNYFKKLELVFNYIRYFNKTDKTTRLHGHITDLYSKSSNPIINLDKNTKEENYDACVEFLLNRSNHIFF